MALSPRAELLIMSSGGSARLPLAAVGRGGGLADPAVLARLRGDARGWLLCSETPPLGCSPGRPNWGPSPHALHETRGELAVTATRGGRSLEKAGSGGLKVNTWGAWEAPNPEGAVPPLVEGREFPRPCLAPNRLRAAIPRAAWGQRASAEGNGRSRGFPSSFVRQGPALRTMS